MLSNRNRATAERVFGPGELREALEFNSFTKDDINRLMDAVRAEAVEPGEADVERVAMALCEASGKAPETIIDDAPAWMLCTRLALAAIRAMRDRP